MDSAHSAYRGRLAPSPTGLLHLGHARTFWTAQERAQQHGGTLVLRSEDLDRSRCRDEFSVAMIEDLHWFGLKWQEGPDCGGPFGPYEQSNRQDLYRAAFNQLRQRGVLFACTCSRRDVLQASQAPHDSDAEPIYPGTCRTRDEASAGETATKVNWRFRVPDGESISFTDGRFGPQAFVGGRDFGDFVVWRHDQVPSYQLAVVVDDHAMRMTEIVRGADLLVSTARQILLYRALDLEVPEFYHCSLVKDDAGVRLAKRHDALSLRKLRETGIEPDKLRATWAQEK